MGEGQERIQGALTEDEPIPETSAESAHGFSNAFPQKGWRGRKSAKEGRSDSDHRKGRKNNVDASKKMALPESGSQLVTTFGKGIMKRRKGDSTARNLLGGNGKNSTWSRIPRGPRLCAEKAGRKN